MNLFFFGVINCDYEKLTIKIPQMVVYGRETTQPRSLGKTFRPKGLGYESLKLSYVLESNNLDSFCRNVTLWVSLLNERTETWTLIMGIALDSQAPYRALAHLNDQTD